MAVKKVKGQSQKQAKAGRKRSTQTESQKIIAEAKAASKRINKKYASKATKEAIRKNQATKEFFESYESQFKALGIAGKIQVVNTGKLSVKKAKQIIEAEKAMKENARYTEAGRRAIGKKTRETFSERYNLNSKQQKKVFELLNNESFKRLVESNRLGTDIAIVISKEGIPIKKVVNFVKELEKFDKTANLYTLNSQEYSDFFSFVLSNFAGSKKNKISQDTMNDYYDIWRNNID